MRETFPDLTKKYDSYHFFYVGYLSNWYHSPFTDINTRVFYDCVEQYMMHRKALLFNDPESAFSIINTKNNPSECKNLGRKVKGFDPDSWDKEARSIVYEGCYYKFTQNKDLMKKLASTKGTLLVEASSLDKIWGIGMKSTDFGADNPEFWRGKNWLGQVLTYLRDDLKG